MIRESYTSVMLNWDLWILLLKSLFCCSKQYIYFKMNGKPEQILPEIIKCPFKQYTYKAMMKN